jgi:hypothetical protein
MSRDPAYDLQAAIFGILTTDAGVVSAMGGVARVYDRVPQNPTFPFVHIGDDQILEGVSYDLSGASTAAVNVHVFSRYVGKAEVKIIAGAVRAALSDYIAIENFETVTYHYVTTRFISEADGLTEHAVVEVEYELNASN